MTQRLNGLNELEKPTILKNRLPMQIRIFIDKL